MERAEKELNRNWFNFYTITAIMVFSVIMNYTQMSAIAANARLLMEIIFVGTAFWTFKSRLLQPYIFIIIVGCVWPLIGLLTGMYTISTKSVFLYIVFFVFYILFVCSFSFLMYKKIDVVLLIWQIVLFATLVYMALKSNELSFDLNILVNALVEDERYGNELYSRVGLGFENVNQLGLFSAVLLMISIKFIINRKYMILSMMSIPVGILLILNSGSRSPIVVLLFSGFVAMASYYRKTLFGKLIGISVVGLSVMLILMFCQMVFLMNKDSIFFDIINDLSSGRLSNSVDAMQLLLEKSSPITGIGPMSSTTIRQYIFSSPYNDVVIDNSIIYYIFCNGVIGLFGILGFFISFTKKIWQTKETFPVVVCSFLGLYAMFENVFFVPNAATSIFALTIMTMYIYKKDEMSGE